MHTTNIANFHFTNGNQHQSMALKYGKRSRCNLHFDVTKNAEKYIAVILSNSHTKSVCITPSKKKLRLSINHCCCVALTNAFKANVFDLCINKHISAVVISG